MHAHDHKLCVTEAEALCAKAGESLTPLRRRVLELLLDAPGPAKAYDLLAQLGDDTGPAKPPTIYRALEFLMKVGLAHRIESLNSFVACNMHGCGREAAFLICDSCGATDELDAHESFHEISDKAAGAGFRATRSVLEIHGVCSACTAA
ncbi:MAG: transcriptional repressor [Caulobacterales bacterium]